MVQTCLFVYLLNISCGCIINLWAVSCISHSATRKSAASTAFAITKRDVYLPDIYSRVHIRQRLHSTHFER
ncbi:hypothetical protein BDR07DRAFT_1416347 [Suillus spraguei]|nr:hypothetical protein BDR07DRAFT_1416347 [Suillus spraguei]